MIFARYSMRNYKRWILLQNNGEVEKLYCAWSSNKNNLYHTRKNILHINSAFKKYIVSKQLHTCIKLRNLEITHAYNVLQKSEAYIKNTVNYLTANHEVKSSDIEKLIKSQWNNMGSEQMLHNFELVSHYVKKNNEYISDCKYFTLVETIADNCKNFDHKQILHLLSCMELWPTKDNKINPEIQKIACAVDKKCTIILHKFDKHTILLINDYFYRLNFLRMSKFTRISLKSLDLKELNPTNFVQLCFFMIVDKKINISLSDLEYHLWKNYDHFTLEELGIVGLSFFKQKTKIQNQQFLFEIVKQIQDNIDTVDDITLTTLLKILRYSTYLNFLEPLLFLIQSISKRIPYLSLKSITQIAHMMGNSLVLNKEVMSKILNRYKTEMAQARLKDIERLSFTLYLFNFNPKTTPFYSDVAKEILNPKRAKEVEDFPMSLVYIVMYQLQMNYYSEDVVSYVMNPDFIDKITNKLGREYLILDYCLELDHPEYQGPRINKILLENLKRYGVFYKNPKDENARFKKLLIDICGALIDLFQSESVVHTDFVLPHMIRNYIILCYDPSKKMYVSPYEQLSQMQLGSIKYAPKDGKKWYAIIVGTHNVLTRDTVCQTGIITMQMRHLERIGYTPILIKWNKWMDLKNEISRRKFLLSLF